MRQFRLSTAHSLPSGILPREKPASPASFRKAAGLAKPHPLVRRVSVGRDLVLCPGRCTRRGMCGVAIRQFSQKEAIGSAGAVPIKTFDSRATFKLTFLFFSQRLRSLRAAVFPGGFVPSHELSARASQCRFLQIERKRPRAASKTCVW